MHPSTLAKRVYIFLFLVIIGFYLFGIGSLPLLGPDEPRYAQVAREMFMRGDPVTPTLGGHTWEAGSLLAARFDDYLAGKRDFTVLFAPSPTTSLAGGTGDRAAVPGWRDGRPGVA